MANYPLKYRTFDQLLADAASDLQKYYQKDLIQPHQLIKVALRVNYELGLRIYQTKEKVLELDKGRVRLPNDFYILNYAFLCGSYTVKSPMPSGTHIEERPLGDFTATYQKAPGDIDTCSNPSVEEPCATCGECSCDCKPCTSLDTYLNCKGEEWELIQTINYQTRVYSSFLPLTILNTSQSIECGCPNLYFTSTNKAWIKDDWLYTNLNSGNVYVNYEGLLEDDSGNIMVPDHPLLNEFYEYALKERILENLIMNDVPVPQAKFQIIATKLRAARNNALTLVNTPNYAELKKLHEINRRAQYHKYFNMFSSRKWTSLNSPVNDPTSMIR